MDMEEFWNDLSHMLRENLTGTQTAEILDDYRGLWPHIEADIKDNSDHRELLMQALAIRDGSRSSRQGGNDG